MRHDKEGSGWQGWYPPGCVKVGCWRWPQHSGSCSTYQCLYDNTQVSPSIWHEIAQIVQVMCLASVFYFLIIKEIPNFGLLSSAVSFIG